MDSDGTKVLTAATLPGLRKALAELRREEQAVVDRAKREIERQ